MVDKKSLDETYELIASVLCDVYTSQSGSELRKPTLYDELTRRTDCPVDHMPESPFKKECLFTDRSLRLTQQKLRNRLDLEGMGFVTKTLPKLGKALDRALSSEYAVDAATLGFKSYPDCKFPLFMGELFCFVLASDGKVLPHPDVTCIRAIRQICYLYYKYELPYSPDDERGVIDQFIKTEQDILPFHKLFQQIAESVSSDVRWYDKVKPLKYANIIRRARLLLFEVFRHFDPYDIHPKHGPGAVATREKLWGKYTWSAVSPRTIAEYPLDAYFYASLGHVCDCIDEINSIEFKELPARVVLVPKDSRGPRLISCEPLAFQWIQQGLGGAIVKHVESNPLIRFNVHFTDQTPNRLGALFGSKTGRYATLDLKEASDRVSVGLVQLLFPEPLLKCLMASRSLSTILPDGRELPLQKYAPMGSALCFPVLALTVWSLLTAGLAEDAEASDSLLVYGDDVIVPTAKAEDAISILESFGLLVNRDKSCYQGFFRESCGLDAYQGSTVTPVRFRTRWSHYPSPNVFTSWVAYANSFYERGYFTAYNKIVERLLGIYPTIAEKSMNLSCPSLYEVPESHKPKLRRTNHNLQKLEWKVLDVKARPFKKTIDGWKMLLRFFAESTPTTLGLPKGPTLLEKEISPVKRSEWTEVHGKLVPRIPMDREPFSVRLYTRPQTNILVWCWR